MENISVTEAKAEVFFTAFNALSENEQQAFITKLLQHKKFSEDLTDAAIMDKRRNEPSRSLDDYLAERAAG